MLGDRVHEVPWLPKLHSRADDLVFVRGVLKTHVMRLDDAGGLGFLARRGGRIDALYVDGAARGRGLGKALLDEAKALGHLKLWTFQANHGARAFHIREGFGEVEFSDGAGNDEKLPDVRLEWQA